MTVAPTILVVEDRASERDALARVLRLERYDVLTAENPQAAVGFLNRQVDLVLSDLRMGKSSGLDLLRYWEEHRPRTPFIMITGYADVESAVAAMKAGAADYLTKPVNPQALLELIAKCLRERKPAPARKAADPGEYPMPLPRIVAASPVMLEVCDQTCRVAQTDSTVLILGESGTGKELIAEAIHHHSPRRDKPFVLVNMAAIPETLVESELFGHVKGAFTGAMLDRIGRFEEAQGGTIFIDEIGDFPAPSQAKLLRVLENRTLSRTGSSETTSLDVRVVAATNRNLPPMVAAGEFREDLYHRLNVVAIQLPPLRSRREDIPVLARYFLDQLCRANHRPTLEIDPQLLGYLGTFDWPGNVRQLRNCLESMVVMARGLVLTLADLPRNIFSPHSPSIGTPALPAEQTLEGLEKNAILQTLRQAGGNRTRAAESLGISVRTLQRRLKEWGIRDTDGAP